MIRVYGTEIEAVPIRTLIRVKLRLKIQNKKRVTNRESMKITKGFTLRESKVLTIFSWLYGFFIIDISFHWIKLIIHKIKEIIKKIKQKSLFFERLFVCKFKIKFKVPEVIHNFVFVFFIEKVVIFC